MHIDDMQPFSGIDTFQDETAGAAPPESFMDLLHPVSKDTFLDRFWGQRPFVVKRGRVGHFDRVISVDDVDDLLSSTAFHGNEIRIAKDGTLVQPEQITEDNVVKRDVVWSHFDKGATIVFEHLNRKHAGLLRLTSACEEEIRLPFRANAYLTPSTSRGFSLHYDTHDVVVLQVSGSKDWQIYDNPMPLPHEEQSFTPVWREKARLLAEVRLEPGDVLYLPRGFIHGASANSETSFHVTIGIRSVTLHDAYSTALKRMLLSHRKFRQVCLFSDVAGTASAAKHALLECIDDIDLMRALQDAELSFLRKRNRPVRRRVARTVQARELTANTRLRLSRGALCRLREGSEGVVLYFDKTSLRLPAAAKAALELVCSRGVFCANDLPGVEGESRLILVRKLLDHHLLDVLDEERPDASAPVAA
jgi:ribosomal protein L16 Arg81 hydroxylase